MLGVIIVGIIGFLLLGTALDKHEKKELKRLRRNIFML